MQISAGTQLVQQDRAGRCFLAPLSHARVYCQCPHRLNLTRRWPARELGDAGCGSTSGTQKQGDRQTIISTLPSQKLPVSPLPTRYSLISLENHPSPFTIFTIFPDSSSLTAHRLEPEMASLVFQPIESSHAIPPSGMFSPAPSLFQEILLSLDSRSVLSSVSSIIASMITSNWQESFSPFAAPTYCICTTRTIHHTPLHTCCPSPMLLVVKLSVSMYSFLCETESFQRAETVSCTSLHSPVPSTVLLKMSLLPLPSSQIPTSSSKSRSNANSISSRQSQIHLLFLLPQDCAMSISPPTHTPPREAVSLLGVHVPQSVCLRSRSETLSLKSCVTPRNLLNFSTLLSSWYLSQQMS